MTTSWWFCSFWSDVETFDGFVTELYLDRTYDRKADGRLQHMPVLVLERDRVRSSSCTTIPPEGDVYSRIPTYEDPGEGRGRRWFSLDRIVVVLLAPLLAPMYAVKFIYEKTCRRGPSSNWSTEEETTFLTNNVDFDHRNLKNRRERDDEYFAIQVEDAGVIAEKPSWWSRRMGLSNWATHETPGEKTTFSDFSSSGVDHPQKMNLLADGDEPHGKMKRSFFGLCAQRQTSGGKGLASCTYSLRHNVDSSMPLPFDELNNPSSAVYDTKAKSNEPMWRTIVPCSTYPYAVQEENSDYDLYHGSNELFISSPLQLRDTEGEADTKESGPLYGRDRKTDLIFSLHENQNRETTWRPTAANILPTLLLAPLAPCYPLLKFRTPQKSEESSSSFYNIPESTDTSPPPRTLQLCGGVSREEDSEVDNERETLSYAVGSHRTLRHDVNTSGEEENGQQRYKKLPMGLCFPSSTRTTEEVLYEDIVDTIPRERTSFFCKNDASHEKEPLVLGGSRGLNHFGAENRTDPNDPNVLPSKLSFLLSSCVHPKPLSPSSLSLDDAFDVKPLESPSIWRRTTRSDLRRSDGNQKRSFTIFSSPGENKPIALSRFSAPNTKEDQNENYIPIVQSRRVSKSDFPDEFSHGQRKFEVTKDADDHSASAPSKAIPTRRCSQQGKTNRNAFYDSLLTSHSIVPSNYTFSSPAESSRQTNFPVENSAEASFGPTNKRGRKQDAKNERSKELTRRESRREISISSPQSKEIQGVQLNVDKEMSFQIPHEHRRRSSVAFLDPRNRLHSVDTFDDDLIRTSPRPLGAAVSPTLSTRRGTETRRSVMSSGFSSEDEQIDGDEMSSSDHYFSSSTDVNGSSWLKVSSASASLSSLSPSSFMLNSTLSSSRSSSTSRLSSVKRFE